MYDKAIWREIPYDRGWDAFNERFAFVARFREQGQPAIREPEDSLTLDLAAVFDGGRARFTAGQLAVEAEARRAFVDLVGDDEMLALDWQHPAYLYSPSQQALSSLRPAVPVFPNGDYYIHAARDLAWGTFGHPWQQSLTVWGQVLVGTLGATLRTWLPLLREGGRTVDRPDDWSQTAADPDGRPDGS